MCDSGLHLLKRIGLSAPTVNLGPSRDAGLHLMPQHVVLDQFLIELVMRHSMRPRPDDGHVAHQYIEKLRQLIQTRPAQERANGGNSRIALLRLENFIIVLAYSHGAEFIDPDDLTIHAITALLEQQ